MSATWPKPGINKLFLFVCRCFNQSPMLGFLLCDSPLAPLKASAMTDEILLISVMDHDIDESIKIGFGFIRGSI